MKHHLQATPEEVCDQIYKFARKGMTPSQIGIVLRDSYGVAQVKSVTGNKILRILKTASKLSKLSDAHRGRQAEVYRPRKRDYYPSKSQY